jgi:Protein of unknown function (DUF4238)
MNPRRADGGGQLRGRDREGHGDGYGEGPEGGRLADMPQDHHYIPAFYLRRWTGDDGHLYGFYRPHNKLMGRQRRPERIGFETDLYTFPEAGPTGESYLEDQFLRILDQGASDALRHTETTLCKPEDARLRSGWSRFLMSLILRHPEGVQRLTDMARQFERGVEEDFKANYDQHRQPSDPPVFEEYRKGMKPGPVYEAQTAIMLLQRLMDNRQLGSFLNGLVWRVVPLESAYTLLTSDRPLVMTNGLVKPTDHLALAIGPRKLFIAANTPETASRLAAARHDELVSQMNDRVCKQARRYVFAIDDRQRTFIDRRLGLKWPSTPVDT